MTYREEQLILKRIEKLEDKIKEQDRKLEMLHDRVFPNLV